MFLSWQYVIILLITINIAAKQPELVGPSPWKNIEMLAEKHPYVVALINKTWHAICTGTIIKDNAVLTSGRCGESKPTHTGIGVAVIGKPKELNKNSILLISRIHLHADYVYKLSYDKTNVTAMHSNIAIVYTVKPYLGFFYQKANIGNDYASELMDKQLLVVGYGRVEELDVTVLQIQLFHQSPCLNPKWYYCVCGLEYATAKPTYEQNFGEGAPVLLGSAIVAVTAVPSGNLVMPITNIKYNIFTVIGPYLTWLNKTIPVVRTVSETKKESVVKLSSRGISYHKQMSLRYVYILLFISKILY